MNKDIVVAKALMEPGQSVVPCRVMNPSDRPVKLFCKTILGDCYAGENAVPLDQKSVVRLDRVHCESDLEDGKLPHHVFPVWEGCSKNLNSEDGILAKKHPPV